MRQFLNKLLNWLMPPLTREEKLKAWERFLILFLFLVVIGLFVFLTGPLNAFFASPISNHMGFYCPGCGGTRSLNYLLHGQLLMAWRYNQLFILLLPLLLYGGLNLLRSLVSGYPLTRIYIHPAILWVILAIVLLFVVLRNIPVPALDFLRPPV